MVSPQACHIATENLAVALGLATTLPSQPKDYKHEIDRHQDFVDLITQLLQEGTWNGNMFHPVTSEFCARYLPQTIEKFLAPLSLPPDCTRDGEKHLLLRNAYFEAINRFSLSPYFRKYLRSTKPAIITTNKKLIKALAKRLLDVVPAWDSYIGAQQSIDDAGSEVFYESITEAMEVFSSVLNNVANGTQVRLFDVLDKATRKELCQWADIWIEKFPDTHLCIASIAVSSCLSGSAHAGMRWTFAKQDVTQVVIRTCGLPDCEATDELRYCSRCQLVRYCCPPHQREHWNFKEYPHKHSCFKTDY